MSSSLLAILGLAVAPSIIAVPQALPAAFLPYRADLQRHAQFYWGIPAPLPVLAAQMAQESDFDPNARSHAGALGLYQFMPATAAWAGQQLGAPAQATNPVWAIRAGVWYDRWLWQRVDFSEDCSKWAGTLAAYNGGLLWLQRRQAKAKDPQDYWGEVRFINPGITAANNRENLEYPYRIIHVRQAHFKQLGGKLVCAL